MKLEKALENIKHIKSKIAIDEIECIRSNKEAAIPVLIEYVKAVVDFGDAFPEDYDMHLYAMFLLAEFRVREAFPYLLKYLEYDEDITDQLLGDIITENFAAILASVASVDDIPEIQKIISNVNLYEFNRGVALSALQTLYLEDVYDRDDYHTYLKYLLENFHDDPVFLSLVVCECEDAGFSDLLPIIESLYKKKLVDEQMTTLTDVKEGISETNEDSKKLEIKNDRNSFVNDTIKLIEWWDCFNNEYKQLPPGMIRNVDGEIDIEFDLLSEEIRAQIFTVYIAEKCQPVYELAGLLKRYKLKKLKDLGKIYGVTGSSGMKKDMLISELTDKISNVYLLKNNLMRLDNEEWEFFKEVLDKEQERVFDVLPEDFFNLYALGIMGLFYYRERLWFIVPNEVRAAYDELEKTGFPEEKEFADLLNDYAVAAVNLYGVIDQADFVEIFNSQNERKTDIDEMFPILFRFVSRNIGYCFWEEYIVSDEFEEDDFNEVEYYVKTAAAKPRYVPDKEDFLEYSDWGYVEETPQLLKLQSFLCKNIKSSGDDDCDAKVDEIVEKIYFASMREARPQEYIDIIEKQEVYLKESKIRTFIELTTDLRNNVRMWLNNGHTPNELAVLEGKHLRLLSNEPVRVVKPGRNEPCPCGSGKKYKKCCSD